VAQREVRSTGSAHGGVGGAAPWPEVPECVEALLSVNGDAEWLAVGSEQRTTVRGGEASRFGLLNDVSQRIRTRAVYAAGGHRRCTVVIRGVAWVYAR
jgi:hypothetical protein